MVQSRRTSVDDLLNARGEALRGDQAGRTEEAGAKLRPRTGEGPLKRASKAVLHGILDGIS